MKKIIKYIWGLFCWVWFCIRRKLFGDKILDSICYSFYRWLLNYSICKYKQVKAWTEKKDIERIQGKEIIKIGFVVYTSSMWFFDELYSMLREDERFSPHIIIGHFNMKDRDSSDYEYSKTYRFFSETNYEIVPVDEIGTFDILFYLTPYSFYEEKLNLNNIKLSTLVYHSSYSYMLAGNTEKLNMDMYHWSFRYYTDSQYYLGAIRTIKRYSGNAKYLGYPKMDQFYSSHSLKISEKKTIIYAPHHSVHYTRFKSATFEKNYRYFLELVKKYKSDVLWIYKPHPLLRANSIKANIFKTQEEYDDYVHELENTGCVLIADSGDYFGLFKSSDAMITDSISFLAEYQFTGKPLLLLKSGEEKYNEFGDRIVDILYSCAGDDFDAIETFVKQVIEGKDPMYERRNIFFRENLDYRGGGGESANRRIYQDIKESLTEQL